MLCQLLLYNKSESAICIHISLYLLPLASPSHPPYPTPLGGHKALSLSPCAMRQFPTSYLFYIWQYICPYHSLTSPQLTLPPPCVLKSILYVCIFIPLLPLASSESFFFFFLDSIYMCQHTVFVFLVLTYFTLSDRLQVHPPHYK